MHQHRLGGQEVEAVNSCCLHRLVTRTEQIGRAGKRLPLLLRQLDAVMGEGRSVPLGERNLLDPLPFRRGGGEVSLDLLPRAGQRGQVGSVLILGEGRQDRNSGLPVDGVMVFHSVLAGHIPAPSIKLTKFPAHCKKKMR